MEPIRLDLTGRIDSNNASEVEQALRAQIPESPAAVVLDAAGLEYISSAGLRVLMTAQKAMMACGGTMCVANPNAMVKDVFDMTGMTGIFTIV